MAKQLKFEADAREQLKNGVNKAGRVLRKTIGPNGRTVVMDRGWGAPNVTDDGESIADDLDLIDQFENIGVQMIREAAKNTNDEAGDGSTTAAVLAEAIYKAGLKHLAAGVEPMELRRGLNRAAKLVDEEVQSFSRSLEEDEVERLATLASGDDEEIGELIAEAYDEVGRKGAISVEEGKELQSNLWVVKGMQFDRGFLSSEFITEEETGECHLDNPLILLYEGEITDAQDLVPLLENVSAENRNLLVIAEKVEGEALATLTVNKERGVLKCAAIKAPGYGDRREAMLRDLAALVDGEVISEELGIDLKSVGLHQLGEADKVKIDSDTTTISGGAGSQDEIDSRVKRIEEELEESTSSYDSEKLEERRARLVSGLAEIRIGAATEPDLKEKKSRAKDAKNAVEAAFEAGVVPGGGVSLLRASKALSKQQGFKGDQKFAVEILKDALSEPLKRIADNAGYDPDLTLRNIESEGGSTGLDVRTGEYVDLDEESILDPAKVVRSALENASSVAGLLFTTECLISELPEQEEEEEEEEEELTDKERAEQAGYM